MEKKFLSRTEAAQYLTELGIKTSPLTLQRWACEKSGPKFHKIGRNALYRPEEMRGWVDSKTSADAEAGNV